MENRADDKLVNLLKYALDRRDDAISNGTVNDVIYWNGYVDGLKRALKENETNVELGDTVTAYSNLNSWITGTVVTIDNGPGSTLPSIFVKSNTSDDRLWCYLRDNPDLRCPRVYDTQRCNDEE